MNIIKQKLLATDLFVDNCYLDKYVELVYNNLDTKYIKCKTQKHHIIPRHCYRRKNLPVDNSPSNIVNLLYKDHILAHYYLSLCGIDDEMFSKNFYSVVRMVGNRVDLIDNLPYYQDLYEKRRLIDIESKLGTTHSTSKETKDKISRANKGKYSNHTYIHIGDIEKHIDKIYLQKYLDEGWILGRSDKTRKNLSKGYNYDSKGMLGKKQSNYQKQRVSEINSKPKTAEAKKNMSLSKIGRKLVSNEITKDTRYVLIKDIQYYLDKGYHKGRLFK